MDPADGNMYTQAEFIDAYGGVLPITGFRSSVPGELDACCRWQARWSGTQLHLGRATMDATKQELYFPMLKQIKRNRCPEQKKYVQKLRRRRPEWLLFRRRKELRGQPQKLSCKPKQRLEPQRTNRCGLLLSCEPERRLKHKPMLRGKRKSRGGRPKKQKPRHGSFRLNTILQLQRRKKLRARLLPNVKLRWPHLSFLKR
eukprot:SAG31_NODE_1957_length_6817_cov_5.488389_10_plen_200_part_00